MPRCLIITNRWLARIEFSAFLASGTPKAPDAHNGKLSAFLGSLSRQTPGGEKCPREIWPKSGECSHNLLQLTLLVCMY